MNSTLVKTPVYQQLNHLLRELIRQGEYPPGAQFLTERQICERFDVSRATANKALSNLVSEGLLAFKKGVGTFVRNGVLHYDTRALVSFTDRAQAAGKTPSTRLLLLHVAPASEAPQAVAQALRVTPDVQLCYIERLRLADDIPVILERRYIVESLAPGIAEQDLTASLYALWANHYGLKIAGADEVIRSIDLRGSEAKLLAVRSGTAGFQVRSTGFLVDGTPLWWEETWYRGDLYEFRNHLGPIQGSSVATGALRTG